MKIKQILHEFPGTILFRSGIHSLQKRTMPERALTSFTLFDACHCFARYKLGSHIEYIIPSDYISGRLTL